MKYGEVSASTMVRLVLGISEWMVLHHAAAEDDIKVVALVSFALQPGLMIRSQSQNG